MLTFIFGGTLANKMGSLKVEVTSKEVIKPSSPTPPHLKTINLSFIDQLSPPLYIPLLFFYEIDPNHNPIDDEEQIKCLKDSLSKTLVLFYPLAGRVQGNTAIECLDQGVEFYEANVSGNLLEVIENDKLEELSVLLPFESIARDRNVVLGVQVNHFSCGGMAVCVCISHKISDGKAAVDFVRAWAMMARGVEGDEGEGEDDHVMTHPKFDGASYFPQIDLNGVWMPEFIYKEKLVTRKFIFDKKMLDVLKEQAKSTLEDESLLKPPTRVEVVSAFIWRHFMEVAQGTTLDLNMVSRVSLAVDLRPRAPYISKDSFGNFLSFTITDSVDGLEDKSKHPKLVREAICKMDEKRIKMLQDGPKCIKEREKSNVRNLEVLRFSSWNRFPVYEVNFGWGTPTRVCIATMPLKNAVVLLSTKCGEGIEAWVNMVEEDMAIIQLDYELLSLVPKLDK